MEKSQGLGIGALRIDFSAQSLAHFADCTKLQPGGKSCKTLKFRRALCFAGLEAYNGGDTEQPVGKRRIL